MRACAIAAIAVWAASSAAASAADVYGGGPAVGYGPYAYSPRIEPLIVYDYQPGVIVRLGLLGRTGTMCSAADGSRRKARARRRWTR